MLKIFSLLLLVALPPTPTLATLREVREVHFQMGTYLEVILWHHEPETAKRLIRDAIQEAHRLDAILSNFDPDSALSRLNRHAGAGSMRVPVELFELLARSRELAERTGGLFDVTIGPLMELWQKAAASNQMPNPSELDQARALVDYRKLALRRPDAAALIRGGMSIDLGGIGKGYAVDRMTNMLKASGISAALINFGASSMSAIGAPPGKTGWEIAVQDSDGRLRGAIHLRDVALSTSGSMGHGWIINDKKYGHLIDPQSGIAATETRMATVVTPSATLAEALTKPLVLIGASALRIVEKFADCEAVVIPENGAPTFSRQFRSRFSWKEIPRP